MPNMTSAKAIVYRCCLNVLFLCSSSSFFLLHSGFPRPLVRQSIDVGSPISWQFHQLVESCRFQRMRLSEIETNASFPESSKRASLCSMKFSTWNNGRKCGPAPLKLTPCITKVRSTNAKPVFGLFVFFFLLIFKWMAVYVLMLYKCTSVCALNRLFVVVLIFLVFIFYCLTASM